MKVEDLKVELQQCVLSKNGNKAVFCNRILEAVLKNLPIFNNVGEFNEAGGTQVVFKNPENGWILGSRWRYIHLKKDSLEEITEAVFFAPTTLLYCRVPP